MSTEPHDPQLTRSAPARSAPARFAPALAVAVLAGAFIAGQGRLNGDLSTAGTGSLIAGWLSYVGTLLTVLVVLACAGRLRRAMHAVRTEGSWWWFAIGLCGVPIVIAMAVGIPVVGVAVASVCSVAGQTVSGVVLDSRGVGVAEAIPLSLRRVAAGLCAVAGLAVAVGAGPAPEHGGVGAVVAMGMFLFVAGFVLSGQQAGNGIVAARAGDPLVPAMTSAAGGLVAISLLTGAVGLGGGLAQVTWPGAEQWWLYLGGPFGAVITVASAWSVRALGTFALTLAIVGGQLLTALVLDVLGGVHVGWATAVAIAAIGAAVSLAVTRRPAPSTAGDGQT